MNDDLALLTALTALLDGFTNKQNIKTMAICEVELNHVRNVLSLTARKFRTNKNKTRRQESPFLDILMTIKNVIKSIDDEGRRLEKEMQCVGNYSDYEYKNVMDFACKKALKEELGKMLLLIRKERPEIKQLEPFVSI